jgi:hypothetical protein
MSLSFRVTVPDTYSHLTPYSWTPDTLFLTGSVETTRAGFLSTRSTLDGESSIDQGPIGMGFVSVVILEAVAPGRVRFRGET